MVIRSIDGIRIASTTSIQTLMQSDFDLVINDVTLRVATPPFQSSSTSSLVVDDEMKRMGDVRALVGQLYEVRVIFVLFFRKEIAICSPNFVQVGKGRNRKALFCRVRHQKMLS